MIQNREMPVVVSTLLHPLGPQNLPRIFDIRSRMEPGERVSDADRRHLPDGVPDAMLAKPVCHGNPGLARVGGKSITLCRGMPLQALDTECSLPV
jgi:hypothetical protein